MLTKIDHLGIAVDSIDKRLGFWARSLALGEPHLEEVASEKVRVAMLTVGESRIELLEPTSDDSVIRGHIAKRGEGIHHVCFAVEDIDRAISELEKDGHRLVGQTPRIGAGGSRVAFVHPRSSGGVLIELKEEPRSTAIGAPGSIVVVCLRDPIEKYWGRLDELSAIGISMRGMVLTLVQDWAREIAGDQPPSLAPSSIFFPLARLERVYLDEDMGVAKSERTTFLEIVGEDAARFL